MTAANRAFVLLLLLVAGSALTGPVQAYEIHEGDRQVMELMAKKWPHLGWKTGNGGVEEKCEDLWPGSQCSDEGRVISLNLAYRSMEGLFPNEITNMDALGLLDLSYNQIQGSLPADLGALSHLYHLSLRNNPLMGRLVDIEGGFPKLEFLDIMETYIDACPAPNWATSLSGCCVPVMHIETYPPPKGCWSSWAQCSQNCRWRISEHQNLRVERRNASSTTTGASNSSLTGAAIAGITMGVIIAVVIVALLIGFAVMEKQRKDAAFAKRESDATKARGGMSLSMYSVNQVTSRIMTTSTPSRATEVEEESSSSSSSSSDAESEELFEDKPAEEAPAPAPKAKKSAKKAAAPEEVPKKDAEERAPRKKRARAPKRKAGKSKVTPIVAGAIREAVREENE